ncbi:MAG: hypothetical protein IZT57_05105, partial [Chloroflexi bacterium]|nr:hypothetical protein [Chloroflexota bacterium]
MTQDQDMITANEALYGTTKITYNPISLGLAGSEALHDVGSLQERSHTSISYNLAENFPSDQIASALKPTMTELAQVTAVSSEFKFCQFAKGVEFKLSNLNGISSTNIEAGINKELWKEWDAMVFDGMAGNEGFRGNSKGNYITAGAALTFDQLVIEVDGAISRIKTVTGITSD